MDPLWISRGGGEGSGRAEEEGKGRAGDTHIETKARLLCYGLDGKLITMSDFDHFDRHNPISDSMYKEMEQVCTWYLLNGDEVQWRRLEGRRKSIEEDIARLKKEAPSAEVVRLLKEKVRQLKMLCEEEEYCKDGFVKVGVEISLNGREVKKDPAEALEADASVSIPAVIRARPRRIGLGDGVLINVLCYSNTERSLLDRFSAFLPLGTEPGDNGQNTMTVGDMIKIFGNILMQRGLNRESMTSQSRLYHYKRTLDQAMLAKDIFVFRSTGDILSAEEIELYLFEGKEREGGEEEE
uniref:Uncharacterized protein n=1 Tax=Guillardia theta TaxID=55529 RepID=A0A7S4HA33_GUITH